MTYKHFGPGTQGKAGGNPLADVPCALGLMGCRRRDIALDCEERRDKYAGAFCFPVQIPGDVRISARSVSSHHREDTLFHEYGHAVHFAGIAPDLLFPDRYPGPAEQHDAGFCPHALRRLICGPRPGASCA
jgi:hypothetical protein